MSETRTHWSPWTSAASGTGRLGARTLLAVTLGAGSLGGSFLGAVSLGSVSLTASAVAGSAQPPRTPDLSALLDGAVTDFERGQIDAAVEKFNRLATLAPGAMPQLWQRGIALYYAGRYDECRKQFEAHRTVNPDDVENAAWHFLCVARVESPAKAKAALLPVGPDARVPMREVYQLFKGDLTPQQVLAAGGTRPSSQFYANLYVGLYYEATGNAARARTALQEAASDKFRDAGGYMHMVARVHVSRLNAK
jgi:lipoprotein NlpI